MEELFVLQHRTLSNCWIDDQESLDSAFWPSRWHDRGRGEKSLGITKHYYKASAKTHSDWMNLCTKQTFKYFELISCKEAKLYCLLK